MVTKCWKIVGLLTPLLISCQFFETNNGDSPEINQSQVVELFFDLMTYLCYNSIKTSTVYILEYTHSTLRLHEKQVYQTYYIDINIVCTSIKSSPAPPQKKNISKTHQLRSLRQCYQIWFPKSWQKNRRKNPSSPRSASPSSSFHVEHKSHQPPRGPAQNFWLNRMIVKEDDMKAGSKKKTLKWVMLKYDQNVF